MHQKQESTSRVDRRLGEEWVDWDGRLQQDQPQAPLWLYVAITLLVVVIVGFSSWLIVWLMWPRLEQLQLAPLIKWTMVAGAGFLGLWFILVLLTAFGVAWLRQPLRYIGGINWSIGLGLMIGKALGISRDKVGHAYVLLHNQLEALPKKIEQSEKLLLLAPRCLSREALEQLKKMQAEYHFSQVIAVGGSEARKAIATVKPRGIIAIACERDLLAGLKDLNGRIPVIAFPNERPEGPCKNTLIPLDSIEKTVKIILGKK